MEMVEIKNYSARKYRVDSGGEAVHVVVTVANRHGEIGKSNYTLYGRYVSINETMRGAVKSAAAKIGIR